jgi:hypothetical protein
MTLQLAQYDYGSSSGGGAAFAIIGLVFAAVGILMIVAFWRLFQKAGYPGWAAIIPVYSNLVLTWIAGKPWWWLLLSLIPIVNIVIGIIISVEIARRFGKTSGFAVGLIFLPFIFFPILAFGDAKYQPEGAAA